MPGHDGGCVASAMGQLFCGHRNEPDAECLPFMLLGALDTREVYHDVDARSFACDILLKAWREWWSNKPECANKNIDLWPYMAERCLALLCWEKRDTPPKKEESS